MSAARSYAIEHSFFLHVLSTIFHFFVDYFSFLLAIEKGNDT